MPYAIASPGAAPVDLNGPGHYLHWGVIQISVANLVVIAVMVLVFVLALVLRFPKGRGRK